MKTKKIYLIRHGQTDHNKNGIVQGSGVDSSLNEVGRLQAEAFYQAYQYINFSKIYTSKLQRSVQSVEKFIAKGILHEAYSNLNEISWGNKEAIPITFEENHYYWQVIEAWRNGQVDLAIEGGESPLQVATRQKHFLEILLNREEEENVLICMHGRAIRILLTLMLKYELKYMDIFEHTNLGLYELAYTGSMFQIQKYNDTKHLMNYF